EIYTLPRDTNYLYIAINLKAIPVSKGDDLLEGKQQELFVDVEVLETHKQTKTGTLNVNSTAFKPDPVDTTNKVVKIWESIFGGDEKEKKKEKSDCPNCLEDFKYDDIVKIFPAASKNKDLAEKLVKEINKLKEKYKINSCIRKAHLINQFGSETGFNGSHKFYGD
ncbi:hypothetical protein SL053_002760, partial [Flavobacterium psychrophilum]|nr:hypothetical protein [Flavobacterium psychrophilum]